MRSVAFAAMAVLLAGLAGCDIPRRPIEPVKYVTRIIDTPAAGKCRCGFVQGVAFRRIHNPSNRSVIADVNISSRFRGTEDVIAQRNQSFLLGPGKTADLGCSLDADEGLRAPTEAECRVENRHERYSERFAMRGLETEEIEPRFAASSEEAQALRDSPAFCRGQCERGTSNCHDLGISTAALALPLMQLLDAANRTDRSEIPKPEILAAYGLSEEDDQCERGGFTISATHVTNSGAHACEIRSAAAAALFTNIAAEQKLALIGRSFDVGLLADQTVMMTKVSPDLVAGETGPSGRFDNSAQAFAIWFLPSRLGLADLDEITDLNDRFGGYIRDVSYFREGGNGPRALAISTARGCLSMPAE